MAKYRDISYLVMIGKRWKEKQKKETVKIFKKCCCGMCGRVAIQKAVEVNYRIIVQYA